MDSQASQSQVVGDVNVKDDEDICSICFESLDEGRRNACRLNLCTGALQCLHMQEVLEVMLSPHCGAVL